MDNPSGAAGEDGIPVPLHIRARHINKRALKNKSLSVSFVEKDLKDFVGGFHKRKKKRRREAVQQQEAAARKKRIELRKKRKLERDFVMYGGAAPGPDEGTADEEHEVEEDDEPAVSVSGTTMYDTGDIQVMVTTSEITREEEEHTIKKRGPGEQESVQGVEKKSKPKVPVIRKQKKKAPKKRSRPKTQSKRDKRKGKKKDDKR